MFLIFERHSHAIIPSADPVSDILSMNIQKESRYRINIISPVSVIMMLIRCIELGSLFYTVEIFNSSTDEPFMTYTSQIINVLRHIIFSLRTSQHENGARMGAAAADWKAQKRKNLKQLGK